MINVLKEYYKMLLTATFETFDMLTTAILIGLLVGVPLGIFISSTFKKNILTNILSFITNTIRSIPYLILVIIVSPLTFYLIGQSYGTQASKIPLSLISITLIIRVVEQAIKGLPNSLDKLSLSLGANKFQTMINFQLKEALPAIILGITSTIISLLSYSTVMGIIGGGGLGDMALRYGLYEYNYKLLVIIVILMIIIGQLIQITGNVLANYFDKEKRRGEKK